MDYKDLTPEQKARAKECKTAEELIALAQSEGVELTDEQLKAVSGGEDYWGGDIVNPDCGMYSPLY